MPRIVGVQFSIAIDAGGDGSEECSTRAGESTSCTIPADGSFTLNVSLDALPPTLRYEGFDLIFEYIGVTQDGAPSAYPWPDCAFQAQYVGPGFLALACARGVAPATSSTYTGVIATVTFTCTQSGDIALLYGDGRTLIVDPASLGHTESLEGEETLFVTCATP